MDVDYSKTVWLFGTYQGAVRPSDPGGYSLRSNLRPCIYRGKRFYRLVQQMMMVNPAPIATLQGLSLLFLVGADDSNLDPLGDDFDHNI
jgi:hypothetical protein